MSRMSSSLSLLPASRSDGCRGTRGWPGAAGLRRLPGLHGHRSAWTRPRVRTSRRVGSRPAALGLRGRRALPRARAGVPGGARSSYGSGCAPASSCSMTRALRYACGTPPWKMPSRLRRPPPRARKSRQSAQRHRRAPSRPRRPSHPVPSATKRDRAEHVGQQQQRHRTHQQAHDQQDTADRLHRRSRSPRPGRASGSPSPRIPGPWHCVRPATSASRVPRRSRQWRLARSATRCQETTRFMVLLSPFPVFLPLDGIDGSGSCSSDLSPSLAHRTGRWQDGRMTETTVGIGGAAE